MTDYRQMQVRQDTSARWKALNPTLVSGEYGLATDTKELKIGDGVTPWNNLLSITGEADIAEQIARGIYKGQDLAVKFAGEISSGNYSSVFAWLHARIQARNYAGIYPGDYFYAQCSAGTVGGQAVAAVNRKCTIAGIELYRMCGDSEPLMRNHITVYAGNTGENVQWNGVNNNNGTEDNPCPWKASKLYALLNGVDNAGSNVGGNVGYDASAGGYLQLFPEELQGYMVEQRIYMDKRYSSTAVLTENNGNEWQGRGKLFVPSEIEMYGHPIFSAGSTGSNNNAARGPYCQFPIFKTAGDAGRFLYGRASLWLSSVSEGSSAGACNVYALGIASRDGTSSTLRAPLCFHMS